MFTGFLMGTGDVIAQVTLEKKSIQTLDIKRTASFTAIGLFYLVQQSFVSYLKIKLMIQIFQGPSIRLWYGALQRWFGSGGQPTVALKKVALDQFLFAPALLASILTLVPLAKGVTLPEAKAKLNQDYWPVLKANYQVPMTIFFQDTQHHISPVQRHFGQI